MNVRRDDAKERLLDAAAQRFRRFGTRHTSIESITTAAGTGKGSLYLHYPSKEELYLATVRHAVDGFLEAASTAMQPDQPAPTRLRSLVEIAIAHYERDDLLAAPFLDDRDLLDDRAATLARQLQRERVTDLIRTTLIDGQRAGTIRAGLDPAAAAAVLFEIGWAIVRSHLTRELPVPLGDALHTLNDIVGHGTATRHRATLAVASSRSFGP